MMGDWDDMLERGKDVKTDEAPPSRTEANCSAEVDPSSEIIRGWEKLCRTYVPRPMTIKERHQFERAQLADRHAQEKNYDEFILD